MRLKYPLHQILTHSAKHWSHDSGSTQNLKFYSEILLRAIVHFSLVRGRFKNFIVDCGDILNDDANKGNAGSPHRQKC